MTCETVRVTGRVGGPKVAVVGPGRAGGAMAHALAQADWVVTARLGRTDDLRVGVQGADVVIIATPDDVIADVSASLVGATDAAVIHLSGSLGLEVVAGHQRRGCVHPLVSLPDAEVGARRLRGAWFAVAGDPVTLDVVTALELYLDLVRGSLDNVVELGPAGALPGPAARGDQATLDRHRAALDPDELEAYDALVRAAQRLAAVVPPRTDG